MDADLRARFFDRSLQNGNDDWFMYPGTGLSIGEAVIDTTGAAAIQNAYASDVSPFPIRMSSFYRGMSRPSYSVVNNRLWLDALFVRDYHGTDTTVFTSGSDKNGMSPQFWSGGVQGIPDKNDILDMFMHVRRAGPSTTDSLWFFGGLSLDNVTGNRYFDFEMYQTDIYYDRSSAKWYGFGPDAGHTSWQFDASGNVVRPGDIIFSAEYQNSSLTNIEARIWIDRASLGISPTAFSWSGQFDGASSGAQYGYASILPKNGGTFYTGLQSGNGDWAGPFSLVLQDNKVVTSYGGKQFMEFSVNLTKLGLDPVTTFGSDVCGTPFNRIVVKTRASSSFTAELKDFVAPIDLFLAPRVEVAADVPIFCGTVSSISNITVQNPSGSSVYNWTTTDGHIAGSSNGTAITVDAPGTYVVSQHLSAGCNVYASDTITVIYDATCTVMESILSSFQGKVSGGAAFLNWTTHANDQVEYFELQRSTDGHSFTTVARINTQSAETALAQYAATDDISLIRLPYVFYRLKTRMNSRFSVYSNMVRLNVPIRRDEILMYPNPASDQVQLAISSDKKQELKLLVFDFTGLLVERKELTISQGTNVFSLDTANWRPGPYIVQLITPAQTIHKKLVVQRQSAFGK